MRIFGTVRDSNVGGKVLFRLLSSIDASSEQKQMFGIQTPVTVWFQKIVQVYSNKSQFYIYSVLARKFFLPLESPCRTKESVNALQVVSVNWQHSAKLQLSARTCICSRNRFFFFIGCCCKMMCSDIQNCCFKKPSLGFQRMAAGSHFSSVGWALIWRHPLPSWSLEWEVNAARMCSAC